MDWEQLTYTLDFLTSNGTTFSTEHRIALQASLCLLQNDNQFHRVQFWGRILGTDADYYIVCGIGKDYIRDRTFFYSINNGLKWILLPPPTEYIFNLGITCKGRFIGDPTADSETEITPNDVDEIDEGEQWAFIKEEERLSATVAAIQKEACIVPRGALLKQPTGTIIENKTFIGLSKSEATQYNSYYHTWTPENDWDQHIVLRADFNISLDFLESIATDRPVGSWAIEIDKKDSLSLIRSLYWPGGVGYHLLGTPHYGWFYSGTGKKNWDVPFMILPPPPLNKAGLAPENALKGEDYYYGSGGGGIGGATGAGDSLLKAKAAYLKQGRALSAHQQQLQERKASGTLRK